MINVSIKVLTIAARHVAEILLDNPAVTVVQVNSQLGDEWGTVLVSGELTADGVDELLFDAGWDDSVDSVNEV